MPRNVTQLKVAIAGYMQREPEKFLRKYGADEVDLLLLACNNARLYAERMIDFELSWEQAYLQIETLVDGADLVDCITWETREEDEVDQVVVRVKKIVTPFISTDSGNSLVPVDFIGKRSWNERVKRNTLMINDQQPALQANETIHNQELLLVQQGSKVFVYPASTTTFANGTVTLALDVIKWMDVYEDGDETDFLLDNCFDWLMYRAIYELNFFLKEDERVIIGEKIMLDAWNSLIKWNNEMIESTVTSTNLN